MTYSNTMPNKIEKIGHSLYAYNFNVNKTENGFEYEQYVFDHVPTENEVINRIISEKYTFGEEFAIIRKSLKDNKTNEFLEYNNFVENVKSKIKNK